MSFALVFNSKVVQIEVAQFPVHSSFEWVDISTVTPTPDMEWSYDGRDFAAPLAPVPDRPKSELPLTADELATQMITDGTMTRAKIDDIKATR